MNDQVERPHHAPLRPYEVEVRMLASKDRVPGVRALAADMALREDLDLDAVDDVRLAVEEACATLVANAEENGLLVCRLRISPSSVEFSARVPVPDGRQPAVGPFSLRVLRTLADSVDFWTTRQDERRHFHVEFAKSIG